MFIKVTEYVNPYKRETRNDLRTLYININNIEYFKYIPDRTANEGFMGEYTQVCTLDNSFACKETPEEIMKLIEGASISKLTSWSGTGTSNLPNTITCTGGNFSK